MTSSVLAGPLLATAARDLVVRGGPAAGQTIPDVYRVAARRLVSDLELPHLRPFLTVSTGVPGTKPAPAAGSEAFLCGEVIYRGPGWVGGGRREVECCANPRETRLRIRDVGLISIARDGGSIEIGELESGCDHGELEAAVLGPALVLALARQGVWCLHASAVETAGGAVLFLGRSGAGKSTLARRLVSDGAVTRRLADDVVPVIAAGGTLSCLPHFPQLKLSAGDQTVPNVPERIPVRAVYGLEEAEDDTLRAEESPPRTAVGMLVKRTVAARLFDRDLLERHLAFCAAAVAAAPVWRVAYPLRSESVVRVSRLLAADRSRP